jgi:hypothetical protein
LRQSAQQQDEIMTDQLEPEKKPDKRERVMGRLRHALDLMIWGDETGKPLDYPDAGRAMNISTRSMRKALERPAVRRYLQEQKQVLRACLSAKSLWHLGEIASQRSNMNAAVNAVRTIDEGNPEAIKPPGSPSVGVTIKIVNVVQGPPQPAGTIIDVTPQPRLSPAELVRDPIFRPRSRE